MTETAVVAGATRKPTTSEIRKFAGAAVAFAAVLVAIESFAGSQQAGIGALLIAIVLVATAAAGVFLWAVPWAMSLEEPGASVVAIVASVIGLLTVVIFWSGLTPVFAVAGILLGWSERNAWGARLYARAAIGLGVAALVFDVIAVLADVV
jgi:hypothetical protein